jgi:putative ubiquitin-RnfH superfamily antitoxin RatB of RatAB toxin-antitoxin module
MIAIDVAYAKPDHQVIIPLTVLESSTVEQAIRLSGILQQFAEIDLTTVKVGIFSKLTSLSAIVSAGDRIEIYRPLTIDPNQARLLRAKNKPSFD